MSRIIPRDAVVGDECRPLPPLPLFEAEEELFLPGAEGTETYVFEDFQGRAERTPTEEPEPSAVEEARTESEVILRQAREEAERLREQARGEGRARGLEEARREVEGRLGQAMEAFRKAAEEVLQVRRQLADRQEKEMVELALAIARKVVHQEITQNPQAIGSIVKAVLEQTVDREELLVRLNPEDFAAGLECRPHLLASVEGIRKLSFERDANVPRGGVLVESRSGEMDGRIEEQMGEIEQGLKTQFYRRRRTD